MDIHEIVKKLIGEINPVGDNTDNKRLKNLRAMTELVNDLLSDIDQVAGNNNKLEAQLQVKTGPPVVHGKPEYSMRRAGQFAASFLDEIGRK